MYNVTDITTLNSILISFFIFQKIHKVEMTYLINQFKTDTNFNFNSTMNELH